MTWTEICDDKAINELPFKVETNGRGQIIMSPHRFKHSAFQEAIADLLKARLPGWHVLPEVPVATAAGVRVCDVACLSRSRFQAQLDLPACEAAPELCVEVTSQANTAEEMAEKRALYFDRGAVEVWICDPLGGIAFYGPSGELAESTFCPGFPARVSLR